MSLQSTFCESLLLIALGQAYRLALLNTPGRRHFITLLVNLCLQVTLPCTLIRTMSKIHHFSAEGGISIGVYLLNQVGMGTLGWLWFRKRPPHERAQLMASVLAENISLFFYPIMEDIAGTEGLALLALLDFPSPFFIYGAFPFIFRWAATVQPPEQQESKALVSKSNEDESLSSSSSSSDDEEGGDDESDSTDSDEDEFEEDAKEVKEGEEESLLRTEPNEETEEAAQAEEQEEANTDSKKKLVLPQWLDAVWRRLKPLLRVLQSLALVSVLVGVLLGPVLKVGIPDWLDDFLSIGARGNMFCSMVLVGVMLDLSWAALKRHWLDVLRGMLVRYGCGIATTCLAYFAIGPRLSPLGRLVVSVGYLMPTPIASGSYAVQFGLDPALCALSVNVTSVFSFFLTWFVLSIVPELGVINAPSASSSISSSMTITNNSSSSAI